ncbi:hypothetical protein BGW42_008471 [Actinomortierella wolfii]|nr:hypothetical protein BGW42_008471 [Actinomortierella wolfii]
MGKKGGRTLNPMDQFHRARARETAAALRDTTTAKEVYELEQLEEQGKLDKDGVKKLKQLREKLDRVNAIRVANGVKPLERPKEEEPAGDTATPDPLSVIPPGRDPKRSIYYDPILNPYGAPPPGQPYIEYPPEIMPYITEEAELKAAGGSETKQEDEDAEESGSGSEESDSSSGSSSSDSDSDNELDSDDDDWMPPLPEGPPPSKEEQARFLAPSLPKPISRPQPLPPQQHPPFPTGHPHPGAFPPGMPGGAPLGGPFGLPGPFPPGPPGFMPPRPPMQPGMPMPPGGPPFGQPPFSPHMHHPPPPPHQHFSPRPPGPHRQFRPPRGGAPPQGDAQQQQQQHLPPENAEQERETKRRKADGEEGGADSSSMVVDEADSDKVMDDGAGEKAATTPQAAPQVAPSIPSAKPKVHPLPPKPGTVASATSSPSTATASLPPKPTAPAGPTSISAAPKLRNLQKELVHLVPSTILRKKVIQSKRIGKPVNAAPGVADDDDQHHHSPQSHQQEQEADSSFAQSVEATSPVSSTLSSSTVSGNAKLPVASASEPAVPSGIPSLGSSLTSTLTRRPLVNVAPDSDEESDSDSNHPGQGSGGSSSFTAGLGIRLPQINLTPTVTIGSTRIAINTAPSVVDSAPRQPSQPATQSAADRNAKKKAEYDEFLQSLEGDGLL